MGTCTYSASLLSPRFDSKLGEDSKNAFTEVSMPWARLHPVNIHQWISIWPGSQSGYYNQRCFSISSDTCWCRCIATSVNMVFFIKKKKKSLLSETIHPQQLLSLDFVRKRCSLSWVTTQPCYVLDAVMFSDIPWRHSPYPIINVRSYKILCGPEFNLIQISWDPEAVLLVLCQSKQILSLEIFYTCISYRAHDAVQLLKGSYH